MSTEFVGYTDFILSEKKVRKSIDKERNKDGLSITVVVDGSTNKIRYPS